MEVPGGKQKGKTIAILTSAGDPPGVNSAVRGGRLDRKRRHDHVLERRDVKCEADIVRSQKGHTRNA
jgi:6-phosphofructokinase